MKKIFSIAAVAALVLSFASCGPDEPTLNPELKLEREVTLYEGQEYQLVPSFVDIDSLNAELYWESSDKEVVTVDQKGNVVAVKKGDAKITVYIDALQLKASCNVTVKTDEMYLSIAKTEFEYGETAAFAMKMRSGKAIKDKVTYALFQKGGETALNDSICRDSLTFLAYIPGEFKLVATVGENRYEQELKVNDVDRLTFSPCTDTLKLPGTWKFSQSTQRGRAYQNGKLVSDTTSTISAEKTSVYGFDLTVSGKDSIMHLMSKDGTLETTAKKWATKNGYLYTEGPIDNTGAGFIMLFLFDIIGSNNSALYDFSIGTISTSTIESASAQASNGLISYAFSFDAKYETMTVKTSYSYTSSSLIAEKDGVPAHYNHNIIIYDEVIEYKLQK